MFAASSRGRSASPRNRTGACRVLHRRALHFRNGCWPRARPIGRAQGATHFDLACFAFCTLYNAGARSSPPDTARRSLPRAVGRRKCGRTCRKRGPKGEVGHGADGLSRPRGGTSFFHRPSVICWSGAMDVSAARVHVVPGGIDPDAYEPNISREEARARLGWPQERLIVLAVRRLARRMGLENLIEAASLSRSRVPDALFLIGGKGRHQAALQATDRRARLERACALDRVHSRCGFGAGLSCRRRFDRAECGARGVWADDHRIARKWNARLGHAYRRLAGGRAGFGAGTHSRRRAAWPTGRWSRCRPRWPRSLAGVGRLPVFM